MMSEAIVSAAPTALYVYGVVPAGTVLELSGAGVDSSDVGVLTEGELGAIVGAVPLENFGEEPLRRNLEDRDWLERTAQAHEAVLERALGTTTVIPFRIATLYGAEPHLREFLAANREFLLELLEHFRGKVELGVKAYFDRATSDSGEAESGGEYLRRRQAEQEAARDADAFALDCARTSHERLATAALDARSNRPQASELSGRTEQMLLNGAYLVERGDSRLEQALRKLEEHFGQRGVTYELTGPWPPYNFVPRDLGSK
jgi:Gas vesicle synthesis protein GvpL/GvpF